MFNQWHFTGKPLIYHWGFLTTTFLGKKYDINFNLFLFVLFQISTGTSSPAQGKIVYISILCRKKMFTCHLVHVMY